MDYTGIRGPSHVVGRSLRPIIADAQSTIRSGAITQYQKGVSLRTDRYRLTKWGEDEKLDFELYDHAVDSREQVNLARKPEYSPLFDSLRLALELRIAELEMKPKGLGRQFENVPPMRKAPNITPGDLYDESGKLEYSISIE